MSRSYVVLLVVVVSILGCTDARIKRIGQLEDASTLALQNGDVNEAIRIRREIQRMDPNEPAHFDSLAQLYFLLGDFSSALAAADSAIELIPKVPTLKVSILSAKYLRSFEKGRRNASILLSMDGQDNAQLRFDLAWFLYGLHAYQECVSVLDDILARRDLGDHLMPEFVNGAELLLPLEAVSLNMKGACYYNLGNVALARECWVRALRLAPNYEAVRENLKNAEISTGTE